MGAPGAVEHPVILFDGVCNLCNSSVLFIIRRDPTARFRFASLQSNFGQAKMQQFELNNSQLNSILLMENNRIFEKSTAALKIARHLTGVWPLLYALIIIPPFVRNWVYDWIAKNRYRWFGRQNACMIPTASLKSRFVEY
ncbi:MAG: thiol-disulfide oxidoreductase DCC family protein [Cyclobacteriaceae bacterium]|nr:thiol-disulfide oxidoreductase DCC family protein [Cyclobacteriaceae bacterium]